MTSSNKNNVTAASNSSSSSSTRAPLAVAPGWTLLAHKSRPPHASPAAWPYTPADFARMDESPDASFYMTPRFVTHIDDAAIERLRAYYTAVLPTRGRILDLCSSWLSHYPPIIARAVANGDLEVLGAGLNADELAANPILARRKGAVAAVDWPLVRDLNLEPDLSDVLHERDELLDAATCVVSVDYLTRPTDVLAGLRRRVKSGGVVHLVLSNRCFATKVVSRWLRVSEDERLDMVADYLAFSGWSRIEVLESKGSKTFMGFESDPLWVVRGVNEG
ncbi:hypothetical protein IWX47DRAFT_907510 [Phyllosticta citricarpa]